MRKISLFAFSQNKSTTKTSLLAFPTEQVYNKNISLSFPHRASLQQKFLSYFLTEQVYIKIMYATCISRYQRGYTQHVCFKLAFANNHQNAFLTR